MQTLLPETSVVHGVRANIGQFLLLLLANAFVGAMIGVERGVLVPLGKEFGLEKVVVLTSFIVSFGITKAFTNMFAGRLADRIGRKTVLVLGWLIAIPVPFMIIQAPSWGWIVAANALLAVNQGLCWTLTLFMKIDLGGAQRRGFAAGINEMIGYGCVALAAFAATEVANLYGLRPYPYYIAIGAAGAGLLVALLLIRETRGHVEKEHGESNAIAPPRWRDIFALVSFRDRSLFAAAQAGMVRNLADGMAWGLLMILFTDTIGKYKAGTLQWIMIACFALGQVLSGALSDTRGRKIFIVLGMAIIGGSLGLIALTEGFLFWMAGVILLGLGGSLMYPTVIGSLSDQMGPLWRATGLGVYRFWRDMGYAFGALSSGIIADTFGKRTAVGTVAVLCAVSALVTAVLLKETRGRQRNTSKGNILPNESD